VIFASTVSIIILKHEVLFTFSKIINFPPFVN